MRVDPDTGELLSPPPNTTRDTRPDALATLGSLSIGGASLPLILTRALADAALAVAESGAKGDKAKVSVELVITPGRGPMALICDAKVSFAHPTAYGKKAEDSHQSHEVWVNTAGAVTTVPDTQGKLEF